MRRKSRGYLHVPKRIGGGTRRNYATNPGGWSKVTMALQFNDWCCHWTDGPLGCSAARDLVPLRFRRCPEVFVRSGTRWASEGAEKSCRRSRRRKRGLRKGKRRSRGCQPRRSASLPATVPKALHSRKINHSGRKYLWSVKASNRLRVDCEKLNKFPRGELPDGHPAAEPRYRMKQHCLAKWTRLHKQATKAGIPPVAAFHSDFWKYLMVETSRGNKSAGWDMLLAGLPGDHSSGSGLRNDGAGLKAIRDGKAPVKKTTRGGAARGTRNKLPGGACFFCGQPTLAHAPNCSRGRTVRKK